MRKIIWTIVIVFFLVFVVLLVRKVSQTEHTLLAGGATGTSTINIPEFNMEFSMPAQRTVDIEPNRLSTVMHFRLATQYKDTKGYQVFIDATISPEPGYKETIIQQYGFTGEIPNGTITPLACDGVAPSVCIVLYLDGKTYVIGANAMSLQVIPDGIPSTFAIKNSNEVEEAMTALLNSVHTSK